MLGPQSFGVEQSCGGAKNLVASCEVVAASCGSATLYSDQLFGGIMETIHAGSVSVDSGQILLIDPCYLRGEGMTEDHFRSVCDVTIGADFGECYTPSPSRIGTLGVAFATGGDGGFPVTVERDAHGIRRVIIEVRS